MLRDWTNSDKIESISFQAEVFFIRLIMKVDDHGCFWADIKRIKSHLFPLKSDTLRDADILRWMAECQKAGLIAVYESDDKKYLQIVDFNQRLRTKKAKFPLPNDGNLRTIDSNPPPEDEEEIEREIEREKFINSKLFEFFKRATGTQFSDEDLRIEVGRFRNKYPEVEINKVGPLINAWTNNIQTGQKRGMVL